VWSQGWTVPRELSFRRDANFPIGKLLFFHWVSCDEIALRKILLVREIRAKGHPDGLHFYKVLYENDLKIQNKPDPEYFKLFIYTIKQIS
jgi:hypothetical protein